MKMLYIGFYFAICVGVLTNTCSASCQPKYDYSKLMRMNLKFFRAQRSGTLPNDNDITWRTSAFEDEKGENGDDLSGGYFDAGDYLKLNYKHSHVATTLAWSLLEFKDGYKLSGEYENAWKALKWMTDYLSKCFVENDGSKYIYAQCGDDYEHKFWNNANKMDEKYKKEKKRKCERVYHNDDTTGTDLAGEMTAAFAASSMVFKTIPGKESYASALLSKARSVYKLAKDGKRGFYSDHVNDPPQKTDADLGYYQDLAWAAAWLYKATNEDSFLSYAKYRWRSQPLKDQLDKPVRSNRFSWANKYLGIAMLMSEIGSSDDKLEAKKHMKDFCYWLKYGNDVKRLDNSATEGLDGMVFLNDFSPNRRISKQVSVCLMLQKYFPDQDEYDYTKFAARQIHLLIGDAKSSRKSDRRQSFVVGFAKDSRTDSPKQPHHRGSSCPSGDVACGYGSDYWDTDSPNPNELTGGLVGGPDGNGLYTDDRKLYKRTEVSISGMAGFQMSIAGLLHLQNSGVCHYGSSSGK